MKLHVAQTFTVTCRWLCIALLMTQAMALLEFHWNAAGCKLTINTSAWGHIRLHLADPCQQLLDALVRWVLRAGCWLPSCRAAASHACRITASHVTISDHRHALLWPPAPCYTFPAICISIDRRLTLQAERKHSASQHRQCMIRLLLGQQRLHMQGPCSILLIVRKGTLCAPRNTRIWSMTLNNSTGAHWQSWEWLGGAAPASP